MTIIIVGHSYGGSRSISVANWFEQQFNIGDKVLNSFPHKVHLFTIDAIVNGSKGEAQTVGPKFPAESFANYYTTNGSDYGLKGRALPGAQNNERGERHRLIDDAVAPEIAQKILGILDTLKKK